MLIHHNIMLGISRSRLVQAVESASIWNATPALSSQLCMRTNTPATLVSGTGGTQPKAARQIVKDQTTEYLQQHFCFSGLDSGSCLPLARSACHLRKTDCRELEWQCGLRRWQARLLCKAGCQSQRVWGKGEGLHSKGGRLEWCQHLQHPRVVAATACQRGRASPEMCRWLAGQPEGAGNIA